MDFTERSSYLVSDATERLSKLSIRNGSSVSGKFMFIRFSFNRTIHLFIWTRRFFEWISRRFVACYTRNGPSQNVPFKFLGSDVHFGSFVDGSETPADRRPRLEDKVRYNALLTEATEKGRQGHAEDALSLFREAYTIHQSEKLQKRIEKIEVLWKIYIGFSYVSKGGAGHLTFLKSPTLGPEHVQTQ